MKIRTSNVSVNFPTGKWLLKWSNEQIIPKFLELHTWSLKFITSSIHIIICLTCICCLRTDSSPCRGTVVDKGGLARCRWPRAYLRFSGSGARTRSGWTSRSMRRLAGRGRKPNCALYVV